MRILASQGRRWVIASSSLGSAAPAQRGPSSPGHLSLALWAQQWHTAAQHSGAPGGGRGRNAASLQLWFKVAFS